MRKYGTGSGRDGAINAPAGGVYAREVRPTNLFPPTDEQIPLGVEPLDTYPAPWFNYFHNYYTQQFAEAALDVLDIYTELNSILAAGMIEPDKTKHEQVLNAIRNIADALMDETISDRKVEFEKALQTLPISSGDTLSVLFGKLARWYDKLNEDDASKYTIVFEKADAVLPLVSPNTMEVLMGRLAAWYDMILKPNNAVIDDIRMSSEFVNIANGDSLQTIAGKLLKWYYVIAGTHATGLIPVRDAPPLGDPPEMYGYLWVDSVLNRVRCKARVEGLLREIPIGEGGGGGDNVRPLEVMYLKVNEYSDPDGNKVPAGPDSDYPPGPTEIGGISWVDPIDLNFTDVCFVDSDGHLDFIRKGVQWFSPPLGTHDYTLKAVDIDGFASPGVELGEKVYQYDYNSVPTSVIIPAGNARNTWITFSRRLDMSGEQLTGLTIEDTRNPGVPFDNLVFESYDNASKILVVGLESKVFENGVDYELKYVKGGTILREDGQSVPGFDLHAENYSDYVYPVLEQAFVYSTDIRKVSLLFNKEISTGTSGWSLSGTNASIISVLQQGDIVTFGLNRPVKQTDTVTVSYNSATGEAVDDEGQELYDITAAPVSNGSTYTPSQLVNAQIPTGFPTSLVLTFDSAVTVLNETGWSLTGVAGLSVTEVISSGVTVEFRLSEPVVAGQGPLLSYASGSSVDYENQPLQPITDYLVTNNIGMTGGAVENALVPHTDTNKIKVIFTGAVSMSGLAGWSLTGTGFEQLSLSSFTISDGTITFTLNRKVHHGYVLNINYNGGGNLTDVSSGTAIPPFVERVDNYSQYNTPVPLYAVIPAAGTTSDITFDDNVTYTDFTGISTVRA